MQATSSEMYPVKSGGRILFSCIFITVSRFTGSQVKDILNLFLPHACIGRNQRSFTETPCADRL